MSELTREKIAELRKLCEAAHYGDKGDLIALGRNAREWLPRLLDLADEVERAKELASNLEPVPLSAGEPDGMETNAAERAKWSITNYEKTVPGDSQILWHRIERLCRDVDRLLAREAKAREEGEEAVLRFIEGGNFLHDDAPPKRFAEEVVAAYRARSKP